MQDQPLIEELADWLETPAGQYMRAWERKTVDGMVTNAFGYHAVQLGLPGLDFLEANRIPSKSRAQLWAPHNPDTTQACVHLYAEPECLPFDSQSIDLLILPHVLECSNSPHDVLREAERVLVPEGRVVITGFNPWSLWGVHERMPGLDPLIPVPAHMQVSLTRLKDWFKLLSLEADRGRFGCYAPPCLTQKWLRRWTFMEAAGDRWWPVCGAVYVVSAVRRVAGMRLMTPAWKKQEKRRARRQAAVVGNHKETNEQ